MRIQEKSRGYFRGTHKGYTIEVQRDRVYNEYGHAYDGYSPEGVETMAAAKREAIRGACLDEKRGAA